MSAVKIPVKQKLFTPQETAIILSRSLSSVWRDLAQGRLKRVRINGSTRVDGESIDAMIAGEAPSKPSRNPNPKVKSTVAAE
jgi:hypothetical protein